MTEFIPPEETPVAASAGQPHSREAEEAVLGAVLINPEVYYDLAQFLQPEDFSSTACAGYGNRSPAA
jgi:replicative DNA helicase